MADAVLSCTSRKTTLMSTCGSGASRLATTRPICSLVALSAMTMMLCVTGSTEMTALPTWPLLLYWPLLLELLALLLRFPPPKPPKPPNPPNPPPPPPPPVVRCWAWISIAAQKSRTRTPPRCFLKQLVFIICLFLKYFRVLVRPPAAANTAAGTGAADSGGGRGRAHRGGAVHSALLERAVLR